MPLFVFRKPRRSASVKQREMKGGEEEDKRRSRKFCKGISPLASDCRRLMNGLFMCCVIVCCEREDMSQKKSHSLEEGKKQRGALRGCEPRMWTSETNPQKPCLLFYREMRGGREREEKLGVASSAHSWNWFIDCLFFSFFLFFFWSLHSFS